MAKMTFHRKEAFCVNGAGVCFEGYVLPDHAMDLKRKYSIYLKSLFNSGEGNTIRNATSHAHHPIVCGLYALY